MTKPQSVHVENLESNTIRPIPLNMRHGKPAIFYHLVRLEYHVINRDHRCHVGDHFPPFFFLVRDCPADRQSGWRSFMALHSAQGPRLGVPQMVQTKGQFGSYGSVLVVSIVVLMYIGFTASSRY